MRLSNIGLLLALAAATVGVSSHEGEHRRESKDHRYAAAGMQAIAVPPKLGEPAMPAIPLDARKSRAAVISAIGDCHYSQGQGPQVVFKSKAAA